MPSITIDNIEYNLPPVVYDILMATADERDEYRARVEELEAWQLAIASGIGFVNFAEGQSGYEVADPQTILDYLFKSNPEA